MTSQFATFGQIEAEAAPTRSDVEDFAAGREEKLGGDMPLLVVLGRLERVAVGAEVGTRVLPVRIQKQLIEPPGEIVVVGDVVAGPRGGIDLLKPPDERLQAIDEVHPRARRHLRLVVRTEIEEAVDVAALQRHPPVHVGFPEIKPGVSSDLARGTGVVQPDGGDRAGTAGKDMSAASVVDHREVADLDDVLEQRGQQKQGPSERAMSTRAVTTALPSKLDQCPAVKMPR